MGDIRPNREYCINGQTLWHGDCMNLLQNIPDKSIDCIICDLPYGQTHNHWDVKLPLSDYIECGGKLLNYKEFESLNYRAGISLSETKYLWEEKHQDGLWTHYNRVIKNNGAIILFGSGMFSAELIMSNHKDFRYGLVWDKVLVGGFLNASRMPLRVHENILVFYKALPTYNPQKTVGKGAVHSRGKAANTIRQSPNNYREYVMLESQKTNLKHPTSILRFQKTHPSKALHPTEKPTTLLEWFVKTYTNEGETVLDNCAGSMTLAVAAMHTNRKSISIERDSIIFDRGLLRVKEEATTDSIGGNI